MKPKPKKRSIAVRFYVSMSMSSCLGYDMTQIRMGTDPYVDNSALLVKIQFNYHLFDKRDRDLYEHGVGLMNGSFVVQCEVIVLFSCFLVKVYFVFMVEMIQFKKK